MLTRHDWREIGKPQLTNDDRIAIRYRCAGCGFYGVILLSAPGLEEFAARSPSLSGWCGMPLPGGVFELADGTRDHVQWVDGERENLFAAGRVIDKAHVRHEIVRDKDGVPTGDRWFEVPDAG